VSTTGLHKVNDGHAASHHDASDLVIKIRTV
jgi:hypothetical protein